jgi:outer membrane protein assembly factor BamE
VVTQDEVNQLKPGMTRRQVQYIMGSPMIADVFHQNRWDYIYLMEPGYGKPTSDHVSLYFEEDALQRVEGSMHPQDVNAAEPPPSHQVTVVVPPKERIPPGLLTRLWYWITFRSPGDA